MCFGWHVGLAGSSSFFRGDRESGTDDRLCFNFPVTPAFFIREAVGMMVIANLIWSYFNCHHDFQ